MIEMIMVIVIIAALVGVSAVFIVQPFDAAEDIERRAELVDAADLALSRMVREVRAALPNSVRIHEATGNAHLEFIGTRTGGRYRRLPKPGGGGGETFNPAEHSGEFEVLGDLWEAGNIVTITTDSGSRDCANGDFDCISVYNTGQENYDAYEKDNIAAIIEADSSSVAYDTGETADRGFRSHSPSQRFYVIHSVVSYVCNQSTGELRRYRDYGLHFEPDLVGEESFLVASNITDCEFTYEPGTATRRGLLTLRLDMQKDGESIFLLAQAQVINSP